MSIIDRNPVPLLDRQTVRNPYNLLEFATLLETLGPVQGLDVLDAGCGEGRLTRILARSGAESVTGVDISAEMIARAETQTPTFDEIGYAGSITYRQVSAANRTWRLDRPVDAATAMHLFQFATTENHLAQMCRFLARNLKPGGRLAGCAINPEFDFAKAASEMEAKLGFRLRAIELPACELVTGERRTLVQAWSREMIATCLRDAGFIGIHWNDPDFSENLAPLTKDLARDLEWYLANPGGIVFSARLDPLP
ncbi:class I SAM-dependent methyltransferase [Amaricoccus macauensis]|uniref:class I SAM-dependent methyltransferase n=1 Tax=Amaricoccus macauensis TaxID=57001 RepID=UPI003C7DC6F4